MKKIILIACLALMSLACLSSAAGLPAAATPASTNDLVPAADLVQEQDTPSPTETPSAKKTSCALITADRALHLRIDADPKSRILAFMVSGEEVRLISKSKGDWWLIRSGDQVGYARAKYLAESECE